MLEWGLRVGNYFSEFALVFYVLDDSDRVISLEVSIVSVSDKSQEVSLVDHNLLYKESPQPGDLDVNELDVVVVFGEELGELSLQDGCGIHRLSSEVGHQIEGVESSVSEVEFGNVVGHHLFRGI